MSCDALGSWATFAAGLGLDSAVDDQTLDKLVAFYRDQDREPRIQVTPFQHPSLIKGLKARQFVEHDSETILVHGLQTLQSAPYPAALHFRRIDPSNDADVAAFCQSQISGFFEDTTPKPAFRAITERVARCPRILLWLLEMDGQVAGSGGLELYETSAVLIAGCVHRRWRQKGLHTAFIHFRLEEARKAGQRYALVASAPTGPTERNALRAGFTKSYTQAVFKQPL